MLFLCAVPTIREAGLRGGFYWNFGVDEFSSRDTVDDNTNHSVNRLQASLQQTLEIYCTIELVPNSSTVHD